MQFFIFSVLCGISKSTFIIVHFSGTTKKSKQKNYINVFLLVEDFDGPIEYIHGSLKK